MPYEATEISLSDIAFVNPSRQLRKGDLSPFIEMAALPLNSRDIDPNEITKRKFSGSGARFLNGDVLLARITPCLENGKTAYVSTLDKEVVGHGSTEFIVLSPKQSQTDAHFLYYLARSPDFRQFAISRMEGTSGRQRVSASSIGSYRFICPQASIRAEIGQTLSALDDCIGLNNQSNKTLEAIAQALFKSWFIDFDPVKAKMAGRQPEAMEEATAVLFPVEFEESEIGLIPKGWFSGTLAEFSILNPESWSTKNRPSSLLYVDLANAKENRIEQIVEYSFSEAPSRARRVLRSGDTIIGTVRPGNRSYAYIQSSEPNLTGSTGFAVLRPKQSSFAEFVYLSASHKDNIARLANLADGGAYPAVRPEVVLQTPVVCPNEPVLNAFSELVSPLFQQIQANKACEKQLIEIRDALLPKLISGKLRISAADKMLVEGMFYGN